MEHDKSSENFYKFIFHVLYSGYIIPKGWKVLTWFRDVHLDPEIYPDPKKFDPSRWEVCRDNRVITFYNETVFVTICGAAVFYMSKVIEHCPVHSTGIYTKSRHIPSFWFRKPSLPGKRSCQARDFHFSSSFSPQIPVTPFLPLCI